MNSINFDRAADYYDITRGFPPGEDGAIAGLFARAAGLGKQSHALEIGVGTGRIAIPLAQWVGRMYGIDLSRQMMHRLRQKGEEAVWLAQADATCLPFAAACMDAVIGVHVFHLIPTWQRALQEIRRVLKPGGMLLHGRNRRESGGLAGLWSVWSRLPAETARTAGIPFDQLPVFLKDAGWRMVGDACTHSYNWMQSPNRIKEWFEKRYYSSTWRMTSAEMDEGLQLAQAYIDNHFEDPDRMYVQTSTFIVEAYAPPEG